jgi:hypothetical protein
MTNPNMHTENMDDEGTITDGGKLSVVTYYSPCIGIMNADGYLRVVMDADPKSPPQEGRSRRLTIRALLGSSEPISNSETI